MEEPVTDSAQFALRSELGGLMRIARISRPGAFYGASVSAKTFEAIGESIVNPIDLEEIFDVNMGNSMRAEKYSHIRGFVEFAQKFKKNKIDANRANLFLKIKRPISRKPISKFKIWRICEND